MRILIYTGKGGVGKTSISAATAVRTARLGARTLIMSTDQAHSLGDCFDRKLGEDPVRIAENLDALEIDPAAESRRAWGNVRDYLKEIISGKANGGLAEDEVLLFPGFDELFSLLRILDAVQGGGYDVIIVDCAPTGETLSLLKYPESLSVISERLMPAVRSFNKAFGGLVSRATSVPKPRDEVLAEVAKLAGRLNELRLILQDRDICSMRIVTTPERIVLEEARRSFTWINEFDFGTDAVYVNRIYPEEAMKGYFEGWMEAQKESLTLIRESFPERKLFYLELQPAEIRGMESLEAAAGILYDQEDPREIFCREAAFSMEDDNGTRKLIIHLPYAVKEEIGAIQDKEDLILTVRNETRRLRLPDRVSRRSLSGWEFEDGKLVLLFDY